MSDLEYLRGLTWEQLGQFVAELEPAEVTDEERAELERSLPLVDPDAPIEVPPSLPRAA